ncbi:UNVERIFIED_CONTAM: hypothetical protein H355_011955 [Colinus virginianus]|nr:hypothetical protein H355_011955 [Colinus virginianus]
MIFLYMMFSLALFPKGTITFLYYVNAVNEIKSLIIVQYKWLQSTVKVPDLNEITLLAPSHYTSGDAANSLISPPIISYTDFYNSTLDHIDLMEEYHNWQCYGNSHRFSFCQYPFIISIAAKKVIIQRDSEQQMISIARQSLVDKVSRRQKPDMNMLFLNVKVRRTHLVSDSLDEVSKMKLNGVLLQNCYCT